jgi:prevent-host-death family protein
MAIIKANEAKRHFSEVLDRAAKGEEITITRYGAPMAMLVRFEPQRGRLTHQEIVDGMRDLRSRVKPFKGGIQAFLARCRSTGTKF